MKLILVRHGETEANVKQILQGKDEGKLTTKGVQQSKKVGKELKQKYKVGMVFCSPLGRCVDTLNNILEEYPIDGQIFMSKLIEERDFGEFSGMETHLVDWQDLNNDNKINQELGVESLADLKKRSELFLEDLKLEAVENVLVVSHRGPIKMMVSKITGKEFDSVDVENASIIEFEIGD